MFLTLLLVSFLVAAAVALGVAYAFNKPINNILRRIVDDAISAAWARYMKFAILVVGISSGVRIYELERYITPTTYQGPNEKPVTLVLTQDRLILELYRTVIETMQGITWMMLVFFVISLLAYVVVRLGELRRERSK